MHCIRKPWRGLSAKALWVAALLVAVAAMMAPDCAVAGGVMLEAKDLPLKQAIEVLTAQSGINIVIADDSKLEKRITASLKDVSIEKALDYIMKSAGISYKKTDDGTYVIGGVFSSEPVVPLNDIQAALPPVEPLMIAPAPEVQESRTVVLKLVHSNARDLLRLLSSEPVNLSPLYNVPGPDELGKVHTTGSETRPLSVVTEQGNSYDPTGMSGLRNGQPVVPTVGPNNGTPGAGRVADQFTGAGQMPAMPPGYPGATRSTTGGGGTTPSGTSGTSSTSTSSNFLWPDGVQDAKPFDLDNSLIVKGTDEGIAKFKEIVRMLDVPPKQVSIKAEFVEVTTHDVKNFGIDWSLNRLNESFNTSFGPSGNVSFGFTAGNLTAQLRAQLTSDVGRVVNAPIISTINNQPATLMINTVIPYWETVSTVVGNNVINQAVPRFINISTMLYVIPRVNGDQTITMMLMPQVADTGQQVVGPSGSGSIPEQRMQTLSTTRRVANGETIVVGGFIRKNDSNSYQRIPILSDLPLVGSLFRTHAKSVEDRELLIFITPTIIPQSGTGTVGDSLQP
ncbi:MAG: hypothetical protein M1133_04640 [Armatimonadetes bacterium]|nr:hypothetical protein [Armatimonadota bacterium]